MNYYEKTNTNITTTHKNNDTKNIKTAKNNNKKIKNWAEYNKSLTNRGNLSIFISESLIQEGHIIIPQKTGKPGRPTGYSDEFIDFILKVRYQRKITQNINSKAGIVMLIDGSGFKVFGEGEWKVRKHGASRRRVWR